MDEFHVSQFEWMWTNLRIVIAMAIPFAVGLAWIAVRLVWTRHLTLRETLLLVAFFAFACGFALWLRQGRLMPIPGEEWEAEFLEKGPL